MSSPSSDTPAPQPELERTGGSMGSRIIRASLVVGFAHLFVKLFGLIQAKALAHFFGATALTDSYLFVFDGILFSIFLIGEKLIGPAFLPVFKEALDKDDEDIAWNVASALMHAVILVVLLVVALMFVWPEAPVRFFAALSGKAIQPGRAALSGQFVRWMIPALFGLSIGSLTYIILNGYKKFFWAAFGDASMRVAVIVSIVLGGVLAIANIDRLFPDKAEVVGWTRVGPALRADSPEKLGGMFAPKVAEELKALRAAQETRKSKDPEADKAIEKLEGILVTKAALYEQNKWLESAAREYRFSGQPAAADIDRLAAATAGRAQKPFSGTWLILGILIGGFAKLITHLLAMGRMLLKIRWRRLFGSPEFKTVLLLMAPLVIGVLVARARDVINNYGVLLPLKEQGLATANNFGRKIYTSMGWLIPYALSIAMFPYFCEMVNRNDDKAMGKFLDQSFTLVLLFFVPLAMVVAVLSLPITRLLFESGRFSLENAKLAAMANWIYTLVLPAYALEYLYIQAFFSKRRLVSLTVIGIVASLLSIAISLIAVRVYGLTGWRAIAAVATGYTVSRYLKTGTLAIWMRSFVPHLQGARVLLLAVRILVLGAACAGAAYGARRLANNLLHPKDPQVAEEGPADQEPLSGVPLTLRVHMMATTEGARQLWAARRPEGAGDVPDLGESAWRHARPQGRDTTSFVRGNFVFEVRKGEALPARAKEPESLGIKAMMWVVGPELLASGIAAIIAFLAGCWVLRISELGLFVEFARGFLKQRRDKKTAPKTLDSNAESSSGAGEDGPGKSGADAESES